MDIYETYIGAAVALAFFSLMGYIFYWLIVIVPRRIQKFFSDLYKEGYRTVESDEACLQDTISQVAAVYPVRPRKDQEIPAWDLNNAIQRIDHQATQVIAHVNRLQKDQPGHRGTSRVTILFIEKGTLDIQSDIHVTPKNNPGNNLWEQRYNASVITEGYEQQFLECYIVYSPDSAPSPLPKELCHALIEICPSVCRKELFCFQGGVNFRFGSEGWGISPANIIYKKRDFTMMLDIFDKISRSLH